MRRFLPSSLTGRLVATAVALVALVSLLISAVTAVAIRAYLLHQLDTELAQSAQRATTGPRDGGRDGPRDDHDDRGPEFSAGFGQRAGTVTAEISSTASTGSGITPDGRELRTLSAEALEALAEVPADNRPHSVSIPRWGEYRVIAADNGATTFLTGLPTREVDGTVGRLIGWEAVLSSLGVLAAGGAALATVRRQLRPLREVARTAHEVSALPLATGAIGVTARVPDRLTDERTEVGQVGAALNTLLGHVEHALDQRHRSEQQVRQFVADASHELRTPLTTISGYAELSRRTAPPDPERLSHAMAKVEAEASRMSSLVEDLLLLARLDAGRPLERTRVDLTKLVLESVADARVVAPGHRWALELGPEPVVVTGDEQRLHQVVTNLLSNARRHTPPGTTVTVAVRRADAGTSAVVTVHDDGPGVPPEMLGTVFERFTRADSARNRASGSVGLGLALVKAITEAHGGRITAESRPGSTAFTVTLPA